MMNRSRIRDHTCGVLFFLLIVLSLQLARQMLDRSVPAKNSYTENVFMEISGEVVYPGVYGFQYIPSFAELLEKACGLKAGMYHIADQGDFILDSGTKVHMGNKGREIRILKGDMSAFYKVTLGIPISVNKVSAEGLTAVRGIGLKRAAAIVKEREKRGGYGRLDELVSVPGIGSTVYESIRPYLTL
jgi:competence protein ComEA